ncbi:MAG: VWA domain-containing protein [Verrucomicrobiota bacterium]|jgi:Ca-activated chloride channel family protein
MKKTLLALGLATGLAVPLFAGETLHLNLVPDRDVLLKGRPQEVVVKIDLNAIADRQKHRRTPLNLAVVLDKSGSMTGAKLEKTKQAALQLVDRLAPNDVFSLVIFSDEARVLVPAQKVEDKEALKEKIESIEAGGSTALYAGVKTGARQLQEYFSSKRINRVILLSDGLANVGPSSTRDLRRLGSDLAEKGISVTTIGVGDDYNEDLMAGLAEASDANYYYVQDTEKLPEIFAKELGELLTVAAREIRIEITCPDGVRPLGFIGRSEKFENQKASVNLSQFTLGQGRYLFLRCLVTQPEPEVARVKVSYTDELDNGSEQSTTGVVKIRYTDEQTVADRSINAAVNAEKVLVLTAEAKDKAIAEADAGNYQQAAATLAAQNRVLNEAYTNAPAAVQVQIRAETNNLDDCSGQLVNGQYDGALRKSLQSQSYNTRNSK